MHELHGIKVLVTSGPTKERIDPVRYLSNDSSGKQGHIIAEVLAKAGASVTLISGPVAIPDPEEITMIKVESAEEMLAACLNALPVDIAICAAAVSDFRPKAPFPQKFKKTEESTLILELVKNPDILHCLATHPQLRPKLVIGFAAETEQLLLNAQQKLARKGCDWIMANDVSSANGVFGGEENTVLRVTQHEAEAWPKMSKQKVAERLRDLIIAAL